MQNLFRYGQRMSDVSISYLIRSECLLLRWERMQVLLKVTKEYGEDFKVTEYDIRLEREERKLDREKERQRDISLFFVSLSQDF